MGKGGTGEGRRQVRKKAGAKEDREGKEEVRQSRRVAGEEKAGGEEKKRGERWETEKKEEG